jgi:hypothetical protein
MRRKVVTTVLLPRLLYGAEIYGMNRKLTDKMQSILNQALRGLLTGPWGVYDDWVSHRWSLLASIDCCSYPLTLLLITLPYVNLPSVYVLWPMALLSVYDAWVRHHGSHLASID